MSSFFSRLNIINVVSEKSTSVNPTQWRRRCKLMLEMAAAGRTDPERAENISRVGCKIDDISSSLLMHLISSAMLMR